MESEFSREALPVLLAFFNWPAFGISVVFFIVFGLFWYNVLFRKNWLVLAEVPTASTDSPNIKAMIFVVLASLFSSFLITGFGAIAEISYFVATIPERMGEGSFSYTPLPEYAKALLLSILALGTGILLYSILGMVYSFMKKKLVLALIDAAYFTVAFVVSAILNGLIPIADQVTSVINNLR